MVEEQVLEPELREPKKTFGTRKKQEQMRLVALQNGELRHVNAPFATALGLLAEDLVGRNILDMVLFKNPDELKAERTIFNTLDYHDHGDLAGLQAGAHILLIGRHQKPYNFFFDWVSGQDGKKYLIASSIKEDKPEEWTHFVEEMKLPKSQFVEEKSNLVKKNSQALPRKKKSFIKAANDQRSQVDSHLDGRDMAVFASLNDDIMCVIESDGEIKRYNDNFKNNISTYSQYNILDCVLDEDKASVRQCLQSFQKHDLEYDDTLKDVEFETRMKTCTGEPLWLRWTMFQQGEELYCLGHNITTTKTNEAFLKRREQELSEAQALAHMGHWRWQVGSANIDWSDEIYKIFGVDAEVFQPTLDNANKLLHKRDVGHMMQAFQRAIIEQNNYDLDFRVSRPDGSTGYVRCEGRCELDEDGDVIALYGVMQDITEQTKHEMELRQAKDSAEQAYASKSRFLANMSHELRTPLNAIIGFSDMLQRQMLGPLGNDKYIEYSGSIKSSGEHLLDLITDILDMSKIEAGKYELDIEEIELGNVVTTAIRMIESRANEGMITLNSLIIHDKPNIMADRRAVMQILLNILSNAVKFTEPGGNITMSIEEYDNHVTVKVKDTGIGIPANKLSSVLLPFEQVSTAFTRNHEGSGLGLTITKELAELHGGMISLESTEGEGTTACIRLPRDARQKQKK